MAIIQPSQLATGSYSLSGSFSGSFQGSGAGLNNIPSSAIVGLSSTQIASGAVTASVSTGTGSFTVTSGSSTFMFVSSSGNVGFGTNTPSSILDILDTTSAGSGSLSNPALNINQTWNTTGTPTAINLNVTNISSSNTAGSPSMLLDLKLNGSRRFRILSNGSIDPGQQGSSIGRTGYNDYLYGSFNSGGAHIGYHANSGLNGFITSGGQVLSIGQVWSGGPNAYVQFYANNSQVMRFTTTTNVLIGTTTDSGYKLDVNGTARVKASGGYPLTIDFTSQMLQFYNDGSTNPIYLIQNNGSSRLSVGYTFNYYFSFDHARKSVAIDSDSGAGSPQANTSAVLDVKSTTKGFLPPRTDLISNISTPAQGLMTYVTSSATEGLYYYNSGSAIGWHKVLTNSGSQEISGSLNVNNTLYVTGSNVGIGTSSPSYPLDVRSTTQGTTLAIRNNGTSGQGTSTAQLLFANADSYSSQFTLSNNGILLATHGGASTFTINGYLSVGNLFRVLSTGNVLINTTTDSGYKLDVNGTARVQGLLTGTAGITISGGNSNVYGLTFNSGGIGATGQGVFTDGRANIQQSQGQLNIDGGYAYLFTAYLGGNYGTVQPSNGRTTNCFLVQGTYTNTNVGASININLLNLNNTFNFTDSKAYNLRGFYYNPIITSLTSTGYHRAIETAVGDVILGSTSGRVAIGTTADTGHELLVSGSGASGSVNLDNTLYVSGSRVGIGTTTPANPLHILSSTNAAFFAKAQNTNGGSLASVGFEMQSNTAYGSMFATPSTYVPYGVLGPSQIGFYTSNTFAIAVDSSAADLRIGVGAGATERMRVLGSTGNVLINTTTDAGFKLDVNGTVRIQNGALTCSNILSTSGNASTMSGIFNQGGAAQSVTGINTPKLNASTNLSVGAGFEADASSVAEFRSTTKGFLPPRMTTTQKNAIATPAEGLMVYDTVLKRPCFYDGTSWVTL